MYYVEASANVNKPKKVIDDAIKKFILSLMFFFRSLIYTKLKVDSEDSTIEKIDENILSKFEIFSVHEFENIFDNLINSFLILLFYF